MTVKKEGFLETNNVRDFVRILRVQLFYLQRSVICHSPTTVVGVNLTFSSRSFS